MALTNVQIYEMTPKTNCKECGSASCVHFSYRVYQGTLGITACPYISGGKIFCPNCKNKIEDNMNFCPSCGKKISKEEENIKQDLVSDITGTRGGFSDGWPELIDLHTQNENNAEFREEDIGKPVSFCADGDIVCPNCGNDIEEGMIFCPYCSEKIPEKVERIEDNPISDIIEISEDFSGEGLELIDLYTRNRNNTYFWEKNIGKRVSFGAGGDIVCPNCGKGIEEGMIFCPYCSEKIPEKNERIEDGFISDSIETSEAFSGEGLELIDLYTRNKNNAYFREKNTEKPVSFCSDGDIVCLNCGNDIEEGMIFCPYCDEKIPEKNERIEDDFISDSIETSEAFSDRGSELVDLHTQNENNADFREEDIEKPVSFGTGGDIVCPNCGKGIGVGMIFCPYCGEKILEKNEVEGEQFISDRNEKAFASLNLNEINVAFQEDVEEPILSDPDVVDGFRQNETPEAEVIPAPNVSENTTDKEILEVFSSSDRDKIRAAFERALTVIYKIENALSEREKINQEKDALAKKKQEMLEEMSGAQALLILSIIPVAIILFIISGIVGMLFFGAGYCVIVYYAYKAFELSTDVSKKIEADKWYNRQIAPVYEREARILDTFKEYCESDEVKFAQKLIPEEYFDSESVQYFIKMLDDGRADRYKEVINLYEEHLHRERVENMQMQSLTLQGENLRETRQLSQNVKAQSEQLQKQTEYMKKIAKNTKSTTRAVKVNAFIGAVSRHNQSQKLKRIEKNTR